MNETKNVIDMIHQDVNVTMVSSGQIRFRLNKSRQYKYGFKNGDHIAFARLKDGRYTIVKHPRGFKLSNVPTYCMAALTTSKYLKLNDHLKLRMYFENGHIMFEGHCFEYDDKIYDDKFRSSNNELYCEESNKIDIDDIDAIFTHCRYSTSVAYRGVALTQTKSCLNLTIGKEAVKLLGLQENMRAFLSKDEKGYKLNIHENGDIVLYNCGQNYSKQGIVSLHSPMPAKYKLIDKSKSLIAKMIDNNYYFDLDGIIINKKFSIFNFESEVA